MADQTANVVLTADVSNYSSQIGQAEQQTNSFIGAVDALSTKMGNLTKATGRGLVIFGSGTAATFGTMAARAAVFEKQMSTLRATAAATGKDISVTERSIQKLATTFPIARGEAVALYTQLNNLGIKGTKNMDNLATTMVKLGSATGESLGGLTQGFVELSRSMGTLAGGQSQRYANSLYTVSRNAGVAASSVLSFANAIAPMARVTGVGMKEVLGISTAFTKAGADGYYAANTFSSMLADISRQVQYGSPNLRKYSDLIGVTAAEFSKMDRTEAITRIFEAIGKSGPEAVKILDRMGYDGIRAARSITAVATSAGGIRKAVADASGSFYGDDLEKGSKAAERSLSSELEKTKNIIDSIGTSIGSSLLGPLRTIAQIFNGLLSSANTFVNALRPLANILAPVVAMLGTVAPILGGLALMGFSKISTAATARYLATTATANSATAGFKMGRMGEAADASKLTQYQRMMATQYANTQTAMAARLKDGTPSPLMMRRMGIYDPNPGPASKLPNSQLPMTSAQMAAYRLGLGAGSAMGPGDGGPNMLSKMGAQALRPFTWFANLNRDFYRDAVRYNPADRARLTPAAGGVGEQARAGWAGVRAWSAGLRDSVRANFADESAAKQSVRMLAGSSGMLAASFKSLWASATSSSAALSAGVSRSVGFSTALGALTRATLEMSLAATKAAAQLVGMGLSAGMRGIGAMGSALGISGPLAGLIAAIVGYTVLDNTRKAAKENGDADNFIASAGLQRVNEKLGLSTNDGTNTMSSGLRDREAALSTPLTSAQALVFDERQRAVANDAGRQYTNQLIEYAESPTEAAAITRAGGYLSPTQLQQYGLDVLKKFGTADASAYRKEVLSAQDILSPTASDRSGVVGTLNMANRLDKEFAGWTDRALSAIGRGIGTFQNAVTFGNLSGVDLQLQPTEQRISKKTQDTIAEAITGIQRTIDAPGKRGYSDRVGKQLGAMELSNALEVLADPATKSGVLTKSIAGLSQIFGDTSLGEDNKLSATQRLTLKQASPEDRARLLLNMIYDPKTKEGQRFRENWQPYLGDQDQQRSNLEKLMKYDMSSPLTRDLRSLGTVGSAVVDMNARLPGKEGDADKLNAEMERLADKVMATGGSFGDMTSRLREAATLMGEANPANKQLIEATQQLIEKFRQLAQLTMSRQEIRADNYATGKRYMSSPDAANRGAGRDMLMSQIGADYGFVKQANQTLREYLVGRDRTTASYNRSVMLSNRDFNKTMYRADKDFKRSQEIAEESYLIQRGYAFEDFYRQREYSELDYQKSVSRAEDDFQRQTTRANDDFTKSMARATEDYNTSRSRSYEDFYRAQARGETDFATAQARGMDDFNRSRLRAQEDFDRSMVRRAQAAAKSIYEPFQRITTLQTMDAANLIINLEKQNKMIQDQVSNLNKLKEAGLSQQAIDVLGLAESANAQQAARLLSDIQQDPNRVQQLNQTIATRQNASTALVNSDMNVEYRQSKEDFALSLERNNQDFALSNERALADFRLSQARAIDDFTLSMTRMENDFTRQMMRATVDFLLQMSRSRDDFSLSMQRGAADFEENSRRSLEAFELSIKRMDDGFKRSTDLAIEAYKLNRERATADHQTMLADMKFNYDQTLEYMKADLIRSFQDISGNINTLGSSAMTLLTAALGAQAGPIKSEIQAIIDQVITAQNWINSLSGTGGKGWQNEQGGINDPLHKPGQTSNQDTSTGGARGSSDRAGWGGAFGGIVTGRTHALIGEAGYAEAVIPLNSQGASFMAATIKEALTAQYSTPTVYRGNECVTNIDRSTNFNGEITVQANDPRELARSLEEHARLRRLIRAGSAR